MILVVRDSHFFKYKLALLIALFFLWSSSQAQTNLLKAVSKNNQKVLFWTGIINSKIPVFMWFTMRDSIIKGEVIYTNTKNKVPIKLIGQLERDGQIRVCEYLTNGTISGIFHFTMTNVSATGFWFSTTTRKELNLVLNSKDTVLANADTSFQPEAIPGYYWYSYGKEGSQGGITIKKVNSTKNLI